MGDFDKTPWAVDPRYAGALVVATRRDHDGRTVVYESELDFEPRPAGRSGWREDSHYWSLPAAGCYAFQADGDGFTEVTVVRVL